MEEEEKIFAEQPPAEYIREHIDMFRRYELRFASKSKPLDRIISVQAETIHSAHRYGWKIMENVEPLAKEKWMLLHCIDKGPARR